MNFNSFNSLSEIEVYFASSSIGQV